ncbi:ATP-binding cassette domain-containing protein [Ruegeria sp.]|uniref:ATP-binding cassette domain-containing protein n=1 Tax=Ruegeria sp. TaxID=1879320 RepID=UPI003B5A8246
MTAVVLEYSGVTGGYGKIPIIRDTSGSIAAGQCLCVLGRNGVGKSTLVKLLSGHLPVMAGSIRFDGADIASKPPEIRWTLGISTGLQERPVFDGLSVGDNLTLMEQGQSLEPFEPYFEAFPVLKARLTQMAGTLSGGERKILSFVRAMKDHAPLTILDEPSEGVQPENIDHMTRLILAAKDKGRAFLVVEQHMHMAEEIADNYQVLENGLVVLEGAKSSLSREALVAQISV